MSTNSGHRRAVQPTQLRSPSNTDHTTIARQRYLEINYILGTCDPFTTPADICISLTSTKSLPELQCGDIYIYLIENPSPYTSQKLKAYKSTDSYLIFRSGWVVRLEGENKKHLHNQSKDECHLIASYQLARYLLLATSYLLLASSL